MELKWFAIWKLYITSQYKALHRSRHYCILHTSKLESRSATTSQIELQSYFLEVKAVLQNEWTEEGGLQWLSSEKQQCCDRVLPHIRSCHFWGHSRDTGTDRSLWVWILHHIFCALLLPLGHQGWHQLEQILYHKKSGLVWWDSRRTLHICSAMDIPLRDGARLSVILYISLSEFGIILVGLYYLYYAKFEKLCCCWTTHLGSTKERKSLRLLKEHSSKHKSCYGYMSDDSIIQKKHCEWC